MHFLHTLEHLLKLGQPAHAGQQVPQHVQPQHPQAHPLAPQDPGNQGYLPDTTYNPNPNTNIPFSSHNMQEVQMQNKIMHQPLQQQGFLPYGGLQGGYDRAAQPLRPGQIPFNQSDFRDTQIRF